jgi:hypothetical protein
MGKVFVIALATLFVCGVVVHFAPGTQAAAFGNSHGISYLLGIGALTFVMSWRLVSKK